jgi:hypothetical protein
MRATTDACETSGSSWLNDSRGSVMLIQSCRCSELPDTFKSICMLRPAMMLVSDRILNILTNMQAWHRMATSDLSLPWSISHQADPNSITIGLNIWLCSWTAVAWGLTDEEVRSIGKSREHEPDQLRGSSRWHLTGEHATAQTLQIL